MTFGHYLALLPFQERVAETARVANHFGVSVHAVRLWANGKRQVPGSKVIALEELTGGKVSRYAQRPDIYGSAPVKAA